MGRQRLSWARHNSQGELSLANAALCRASLPRRVLHLLRGSSGTRPLAYIRRRHHVRLSAALYRRCRAVLAPAL